MGLDFKGSVPTFAALPSSGQAEGHAYVVADEQDKLYVWDADTTSWVDGGSIQGPPGPPGTPGAPGSAGARGSGWFVGNGAPGSIPGALVGDLYLDLISGEVHQLQPPPAGFSLGDLPAIGAAFQGGFYGGLISQAANGIASHALIIAPKSTGENNLACKTANTATAGTGSSFDGFANSEAAKDAAHPANQWARALAIGGYDDWFIPALLELEILYRRFKPDNSEGNTPGFGANAYAVPPTSADYSGVIPAQSAVALFAIGGAEEFFAGEVGTSTQDSATTHQVQDWYYGNWDPSAKTTARTVRAIRKIAVVP
jgi:hypothetical protein